MGRIDERVSRGREVVSARARIDRRHARAPIEVGRDVERQRIAGAVRDSSTGEIDDRNAASELDASMSGARGPAECER